MAFEKLVKPYTNAAHPDRVAVSVVVPRKGRPVLTVFIGPAWATSMGLTSGSTVDLWWDKLASLLKVSKGTGWKVRTWGGGSALRLRLPSDLMGIPRVPVRASAVRANQDQEGDLLIVIPSWIMGAKAVAK